MCIRDSTGTDVSKEASDMILTDDNFATIVDAVREGRSIFQNIRKYLVFLLSGNLGTVLALVIASALPQHIQEMRVAGMSATLLSLGQRAAHELGRGKLQQVLIRGEHGYVVMINAGNGTLLLVPPTREAKLGLVGRIFARVGASARGAGVLPTIGRDTPPGDSLPPPVLFPSGRRIDLLQFCRLLPGGQARQLGGRGVVRFPVGSFTARSLAGYELEVQVDGDGAGTTPVTVGPAGGKVRFLVPRGEDA